MRDLERELFSCNQRLIYSVARLIGFLVNDQKPGDVGPPRKDQPAEFINAELCMIGNLLPGIWALNTRMMSQQVIPPMADDAALVAK